MSYHYPIYSLVTRQEGGATPNFGARKGFRQDVRVGTSAKNSHSLAEITVSREELPGGEVCFRLFIDGQLAKLGVLNGKEFDLGTVPAKVAA